jgi:hypothetical protein
MVPAGEALEISNPFLGSWGVPSPVTTDGIPIGDILERPIAGTVTFASCKTDLLTSDEMLNAMSAVLNIL